ncbi:hypothetical protein L596_028805 [Steinernema carpocapsae]|uniref:Uncharacterized protein n=1 Tax=Steinernema carpocapsae TaxID=34508 RepID=A0A4U5LZH5_STECR|nr:hypothetical protein L596_028805 [Steinernema carpocapsae]
MKSQIERKRKNREIRFFVQVEFSIWEWTMKCFCSGLRDNSNVRPNAALVPPLIEIRYKQVVDVRLHDSRVGTHAHGQWLHPFVLQFRVLGTA